MKEVLGAPAAFYLTKIKVMKSEKASEKMHDV